MLTRRAWWLVMVSAVLVMLGLASGSAILWMAALTVILWIVGEGLLFNLRAKLVIRGLKLRRIISDERGPVTSLWAGRPFEVQLTLRLEEGPLLPYIAFEEPVPFALEVTDGEAKAEGAIGPGQPMKTSYSIRAARPGAARFEGVRVQFADHQGLFYHVAFVRLEAEYRILPPLADAEGKTPTSKRYNLLPPPGIHRLPRPGSGSELLDLRDYMPGDPPKTIAWKVSARRDKLITKEYESEVPVRCTLFMDVSQSVRLGPPGRNALTRLVEIAAGVAQANLASRDMTGLCLFDEEETRIIKPARTRRHLVLLFNELADAAARRAAAGSAPIDPYLPLAHAYAQEIYPELLNDGINRMPRWLTFWVRYPSHWSEPGGLVKRLCRWGVYLVGGLFYWIVAIIITGELQGAYAEIPEGFREELLGLFDSVFMPIIYVAYKLLPEWLFQFVPTDTITWGMLILCSLLFPVWLLFLRDAVPLLFQPKRRRLARLRKKMAALLSQRYELGGGGLELLLEDDRKLGTYLERFLNEHHVPHTPQLFDSRGHYLFRSTAKLERLTAALLRAVGKGHDNELFVLFVDLVELEHDLDPLLRAVKVALARHHQVFVVLPWPPELELPRRAEQEKKPAKKRGAVNRLDIKQYVQDLMSRRYQRAFQRVRKTFARLQVPVVCAAETDPIPLILERIDRLRGQRRRRR